MDSPDFSCLQDSSQGIKFQDCFRQDRSFEQKCKKFQNTLNDTLHKCFKKIRITKNGNIRGKKKVVHDLIREKNKLSLSLNTIECKLGRCIIENEIQRLEDNISEISASHTQVWLGKLLKNKKQQREIFLSLECGN